MVMAQSLTMLLAARHPDTHIDMLAPQWSLPIIERMPEVHEGIVLPTRHAEIGLRKRFKVAKKLRPGQYEQAIVLPRSLKAALVPWFAGIPRRTGYRGEMRYVLLNDIRAFDRAVLNQTVKRFCALGLEPDEVLTNIPSPGLRVSSDNQRRVMDKLGLRPERRVIAMMPGAEFGPAKCWPVEYFAELAAELVRRDIDVWVLGSASDDKAGTEIGRSRGVKNLCGKTELADVVDLLAACEQAVSNDSGLMHIAAAVGTRVVGIYGSTSPGFTPPLTDNKVLHNLQLECSPCFQRNCPLGHLRCLRDIKPAAVLESILDGNV
jgi:heptosyltransferase-2